MEGRILDAHTGRALLTPVEFETSAIAPLQPDWNLELTSRWTPHGPPQEPTEYGRFSLDLPRTELELRVRGPAHQSRSAYDQTFTIDARQPIESPLTFRAERRPGILFRTLSSNPTLERQILLHGPLIITATSPVDATTCYAEKGEFWFLPLPDWGAQTRVRAFWRDRAGDRTLLERDFTARIDEWPVTLELELP